MASLAAHVRLRPIRFGFLVKPDDAAGLLEVFRVNTCLWGGKFNPIIPLLTSVPKWWDRHGFRSESAGQIVNGYLDFFEPDFLVESVPGLAAGVPFDSARVLQLSEMLQRENDNHKQGHGQSVLALYQDRYRKVFQFARRHEHDIVRVTPEDTAFAHSVACMMGAFPETDDLAYFSRAFTDAFEPKSVILNAQSFVDLHEKNFTSALRLGHLDIDVDFDHWPDPTMFVFDAKQPKDLIDLWNLRAVRRKVLPIPLQWLAELSPFCRKVIEATYRPLPNNPHGVMIREWVIFGRAIPTDEIPSLFEKYLQVPIDGANVRQDWYPPLWQRASLHGRNDRRPVLIAGRKTFNAPPEAKNAELRFDSIYPEWSDEYGSDHRWANVVKIDGWSERDGAAMVFPNERLRGFVPRFRVGIEHTLSTTEGIVIFPQYKNIPERWELPDGGNAIGAWLKSNGIPSAASDAGRATEQIVQTLGGFSSVGDVATKGIVETLNGMSRSPTTRSAHHKEFRNKIENATKDDIWRRRSFDTLVERNAVELGLEVRCDKCSTWSWFALNRLDYTLQCSLCLRRSTFPIVNPGDSKSARWAYRVIGPFALPDYARGGYASALALRCFANVIGGHRDAHVTWCGGRELTLTPEGKVEADFVLWYQRRGVLTEGQDSLTDVVFGEAKSFGKDVFGSDDVAHLKAIALRFPGAVLVFATMKQPAELSSAEIAAIRKVALWGRRHVRGERGTRAPVIVLTGIELFAGFSLQQAWKEVGGRHSHLAEAYRMDTHNLRTVADITQQLYLDLPPYSVWLQAKWDAINARRKAKLDSAQAAAAQGTA